MLGSRQLKGMWDFCNSRLLLLRFCIQRRVFLVCYLLVWRQGTYSTSTPYALDYTDYTVYTPSKPHTPPTAPHTPGRTHPPTHVLASRLVKAWDDPWLRLQAGLLSAVCLRGLEHHCLNYTVVRFKDCSQSKDRRQCAALLNCRPGVYIVSVQDQRLIIVLDVEESTWLSFCPHVISYLTLLPPPFLPPPVFHLTFLLSFLSSSLPSCLSSSLPSCLPSQIISKLRKKGGRFLAAVFTEKFRTILESTSTLTAPPCTNVKAMFDGEWSHHISLRLWEERIKSEVPKEVRHSVRFFDGHHTQGTMPLRGEGKPWSSMALVLCFRSKRFDSYQSWSTR